MQARPECAGEARVSVRDECGGQPHVAEHRRYEFAARRRLGGGGFAGRNRPHAPGQTVDVHLQKVVAGTGDGQLEDVEADAPSAACGVQHREQPADRWYVVDFDALTV